MHCKSASQSQCPRYDALGESKVRPTATAVAMNDIQPCHESGRVLSTRYTLMRCTPVRYTPMRYTPVRGMLMRYTRKMHVYDMYACKVHAPETRL